MSDHEDVHARVQRTLVEKWHNRDCECTNPECPTRAAAAERAVFVRQVIGSAVRKLASDE